MLLCSFFNTPKRLRPARLFLFLPSGISSINSSTDFAVWGVLPSSKSSVIFLGNFAIEGWNNSDDECGHSSSCSTSGASVFDSFSKLVTIANENEFYFTIFTKAPRYKVFLHQQLGCDFACCLFFLTYHDQWELWSETLFWSESYFLRVKIALFHIRHENKMAGIKSLEMDDSSYRLNFNPGKKNKIQYHN